MRIVPFEEFVRMKQGTVFAPFSMTKRENMEGLAIKMDSGSDASGVWYFEGTIPLDDFDICHEGRALKGEKSEIGFYMDQRDYFDFSDYELFCVLDSNDIQKIIDILEEAKELTVEHENRKE